MAVPMFRLDAVFSATLRVVLVPSVNTGALFPAASVVALSTFDHAPVPMGLTAATR